MINQAGEYALRAVVHLARRDGLQLDSASDIAAATNVPQAYLQKILRTLTKQNILIAQRGMGGGFKLAKLSSAISVLEVLKACDSGPSRIERCPLGIAGHTQLCSLHRLIDQQTASVESTFASTSIEDLVSNQDLIRPLCDPNSSCSPTVDISISDQRNQI